MLRSFRLGNHRSFGDEVELLLMPDGAVGATSVVPVTAIYGANASGKSNLIDGLIFMRDAVLESFGRWEVDGGVPRLPFRFGASVHPSVFVVEIVSGGVPYTYGFTVDGEAVREEWLYSSPKKRPRKIFERVDGELTLGSTVSGELRAQFRLLQNLIRPNALFLSGCANTRLDVVMPVFRWFQSDLRIRRLDTPRRSDRVTRQVQRFMTSPDTRSRLVSLLAAADVAISDVQVEEVDAKRPELRFVHGDEEEPFVLDDESAGTRNWLELLPTVLEALERGQTVVIDEIDASLHPMLTARLIGLFQDSELNPHAAQLLFTTHDTSLLGTMLGDEVLRREQVWFVEKGSDGMSVAYALTDFKPRKDQNTERRYLGGSYGAVPILDPQEFADAVLSS